MSVFKNGKTNTWYVMTRYTDWKGERKQKCKRGFSTKSEAFDWERKFHQQTNADMDMTFTFSFVHKLKANYIHYKVKKINEHVNK